jgi:hypothetical protein
MLSRPAQKKKKEQEELQRRRQREIEAAEESSREAAGPSDEQMLKPENAKDDWKQSIEDVLEEMGLPVERKPAPVPMDQPSPEETTPRRESPVEEQSLENLEPEIAPEKVVPEKAVDEKMKSHLAIQEAAYNLTVSPINSQKAYATVTDSASTNIFDTPRETVMAQYTTDDLRKFIVWSELLGKPIGLREEMVPPQGESK